MTSSLRTPADIGAAIKARRRALGLDQAELARRIGASRLWVNQVEHGKPGASIGLVLRAFAALGIVLAGNPVDAENALGAQGPSAPVFDLNSIVEGLRRKARQ